jgi:hypothetical protein
VAALEAERNRHAATLSAELGRLQMQLDHDRHMADLADLRAVLEYGLDAVDDYFRRTALLVRAEGEEARDKAASEVGLTWEALHSTGNKLQLRLRDDDPILVGFRRYHETLAPLREAAFNGDVDAHHKATEATGAAFHPIVQAAKERVGTSLAD